MNARQEYQNAIENLKKAYTRMQSLEAKLLTKQAYQHLKNLNWLLEHPEQQDNLDKTPTKPKSFLGFLKKKPKQEELVSIR